MASKKTTPKSGAEKITEVLQLFKTIEQTTVNTAKAWMKQIPENEDLQNTFKKLGLATSEEVKALNEKINVLESELENLKKSEITK